VSLLRLLTFVAWLAWGAGIAGAATPAQAASPAPGNATAVVEDFDLEQVSELAPGVALNFSVYGSPRAEVTLYIEGVSRLVDLAESRPGIYEGSYVINASDRLRNDSKVIATLQRDGQVVRSTLAEPLLLERGTVPWANDAAQAAAPPRSSIAVAPRDDAPPGTPRGGEPVPFAEPAPQVVPAPPIAPVPRTAPSPRLAPAPTRPACGDCAVVEAIRAEPVAERRGVVGALAGGIAGAILGEKLAEAHRRHVMQVLGAVTGALLGREIEMRQTSSPAYTVVLRLADGSALERRYDQPPPFRVGDSVSLSGSGTRSARTAIF